MLCGGKRRRELHLGHEVKDIVEAVRLGDDCVAALELVPQTDCPPVVLNAVVLNSNIGQLLARCPRVYGARCCFACFLHKRDHAIKTLSAIFCSFIHLYYWRLNYLPS